MDMIIKRIRIIFKKRANHALVIIANTIKGKGIPSLENNFSSHYVKINEATAQKWKEE